jgi:DNA polymerase-3 subunit beta
MKFRIAREEWLPVLQVVLGAVDRKQAVPILGNVLVSAERGEVLTTGTDLEIEVRAVAAAEVEREGRSTVTARKLWEIWRNLPAGAAVEIAATDSRVSLKAGSARFTLAALDPAGFPASQDFEAVVRFELPAERLRELVERTHFAMAQQDVRYYLNGLLFETREGGRLRLVGTDGHRLAICETQVEADRLPAEGPHQAILPRKGVLELLRLGTEPGERVRVEIGAQALRVSAGLTRLSSRLVEGRFPEYERVVPDPAVWNRHVVAEREPLRQGLVRAAILANERYRAVRLNLEAGRLRIQAENAEQEEAVEELAVEYEGTPIEIGFNVGYLVDAIAAVRSERVRMCLQDEGSSCLIDGYEGSEGCRYVVMPMRL